jgi:hypothetical protein
MDPEKNLIIDLVSKFKHDKNIARHNMSIILDKHFEYLEFKLWINLRNMFNISNYRSWEAAKFWIIILIHSLDTRYYANEKSNFDIMDDIWHILCINLFILSRKPILIVVQ